MSRVILISNRLPVTIKQSGTERIAVRSAGGLVAGLGPVHDAGGSLWVGSVGANTSEAMIRDLSDQRLLTVPLAAEDAKRHYEGMSNQVLWPLFHYLTGHVAFDERDWQAYVRVNERFADVVAQRASPGDLIWVHDYQLMLLPQMLRQRLPRACIGFFLHIPFPSSEVFRVLPHKEELLRGLLGANLIGLHTYDYARHLVSTFRRVLGVEFDEDWLRISDAGCRVGVFPLGVDAEALRERASTPTVEARARELSEQVGGRRVILGVDRMDYTKGLPLRLEAFKALLEGSSKWRNRAVLFQLAVPSRSTIGSYQDLKHEVERAVGEINGRFSEGGIAPVHYMYRSVPQDELAALYRLADVALVTPVRDGMNLVAKEYVASRVDDTGVLMLSEFAGAASEMGEAMLVNPWDVNETASALEVALDMNPEDVANRMAALRRRVANNHVGRWAESFMKALKAFAGPRRGLRAELVVAPGADIHQAWSERLAATFAVAECPLVALDYDGTLTEIVGLPSQAAPTAALRELVSELASLEGVTVVVISGRDPTTLGDWFSDLPVDLVAEHGVHRRLAGASEWEQTIDDADLTWKDGVRDLLEDYVARSPGALVEEKPFSLAWHYRNVEPGFGMWQARELAQHLAEAYSLSPISVLHGSKVVEVRPRGMDKGRALQSIVGPKGEHHDLVLVAGDDRTDEDMFAAAPSDAWTIKVGMGPTQARFGVIAPSDLRDLLNRLVEARRHCHRQMAGDQRLVC